MLHLNRDDTSLCVFYVSFHHDSHFTISFCHAAIDRDNNNNNNNTKHNWRNPVMLSFSPSSSILNQSKEVCYPTLRHLDIDRQGTMHSLWPLDLLICYSLFDIFVVSLLSNFSCIYVLNILFQVEVQNHSKENRMNVKYQKKW